MKKYSNYPGYQSWDSMKRRCDDATHKDYAHYGAKGITYDPRWKDISVFFADMGFCPEGHTLDRRDNDKGYYKENCRWATKSQQAQNRQIFKTNKSGVVGVTWNAAQQKWATSRMLYSSRTLLYWGRDFFEAACASKSWDNQNGDCK